MGLSSKQVSSDRNGWNQALLEGAGTLEFPKTPPTKQQQQQQQQESDQQQEQQPEKLKCPRCDSGNTKFCYYNNYNKSQPRHFCKACKRHWTKGGTLRNVPVGGGRKNKRLKTSKTAPKTTHTTTSATTSSGINNNNNNMGLHGQQLRVGPTIGGSLRIEDKGFSETFYQNFLKQQHQQQQQQQQQQHQKPETSSITFSSMGLNDGVFLGSAATTTTTNLGLCEQQQQHHDHDDQEMQLPYSNLYNFTGDHHHHQHQPWTLLHTTSSSTTTRNNINSNSNNNNNNINNNLMDLSSNWGWDDFDKFVSVEADLTMPWDDSEMEP